MGELFSMVVLSIPIPTHATSLNIKIFFEIKRKLKESNEKCSCGPPFGFFPEFLFQNFLIKSALVQFIVLMEAFIDSFCILLQVLFILKPLMASI